MTALEKQTLMVKKIVFYSIIASIITVISSGFKPLHETDLSSFYNIGEEVFYFNVPSQSEADFRDYTIPYTGKSFAGFKQALAFKESQGKYRLVNTFGYMGKYQFGEDALQMVGVRDSLSFMNNPVLQEKAFLALLAINKWELRSEIAQYEGQVISGVKITESGLLAAAHLGGAGSVKRFLKTNGSSSRKDGYGTSIKSYIRNYGGYDTSQIVANKNAKARHR